MINCIEATNERSHLLQLQLIYEAYYCNIKSMDSHCGALVLLIFCPAYLYQWMFSSTELHTHKHTETHASSTMITQLNQQLSKTSLIKSEEYNLYEEGSTAGLLYYSALVFAHCTE